MTASSTEKDGGGAAVIDTIRGVEEMKERGAQLYKVAQYNEARELWKIAFDELSEAIGDRKDPGNAEAVKLLISLHLNLSMAALQLGDNEQVINETDAVLELQPEHSKAFYRRALAEEALGRIQVAAADMYKAAKLEPQSVPIRKKYEELKKKALEIRQSDDMDPEAEERVPEHDLTQLPRVFLDVKVGQDEPVRLVFALYTDTAPKTSENFRQLCTGEHDSFTARGKPFCYKGSVLHRMIPGLMVQGGDFDNSNGTGGESIYGRRFADETFADRHARRGLLAMANDGPNTNGSNFFVTFAPAQHLDRKHVIFGEVVESIDLLDRIEALPTNAECRPVADCVVVDCGDLGQPSV